MDGPRAGITRYIKPVQPASYEHDAPPSPRHGATTPADHYRRRARKLRWVHAGRPDRLHPALVALAKSHDAATRGRHGRATHVEREPAEAEPYSPAKAFAEHVARAMDGQVLRYSQRLALLQLADRQGLGRFEANLVIAAIQHRMRQASGQPVDAESTTVKPSPRRRATLPLGLLVFATVQALIALGAWRILA